MSISNPIVDEFQQKFEMVSYLSKIMKSPQGLFKKDNAPPKTIEKKFYESLSKWVESMIVESVGGKQENDPTAQQFSPYEIQVLKSLVNRMSKQVINNNGSPTVRASQPVSVPTHPIMNKNETWHVIDSSICDGSDVEANEKVVILKDRGSSVEVRSMRKPTLVFTTQKENLSKEPM